MKNYNLFTSLGDYLKYLRLHVNKGQREIGKIIMPKKRYGNKSVSKIENGHQRISREQIVLFAKGLEYPEEVLIEAYNFFSGVRPQFTLPMDATEDLRPLLKVLSESGRPVTGDMLVKAISHLIALRNLGMSIS